jgi:hypothetical protein
VCFGTPCENTGPLNYIYVSVPHEESNFWRGSLNLSHIYIYNNTGHVNYISFIFLNVVLLASGPLAPRPVRLVQFKLYFFYFF